MLISQGALDYAATVLKQLLSHCPLRSTMIYEKVKIHFWFAKIQNRKEIL